MSIRKLRRLQLGRETTGGTAVAATALWRGMGTLDDRRELVFVDEDIGYVSGVDRTMTPRLLAGLTMEDTPATFEQLPYLLEAGVKAVNTGAADGAGSSKIYTYTFPSTAANSINYYTIEGGDDQQEEEMEYSFVESLTLSGDASDGVLSMTGAWLGRQVTASTFTTQPATPAVDEVLFLKGALYIDAIGGTIGTTQKSNTFLAFSLDVTTGWVPLFTAEGNQYYSQPKFNADALEVVCEVTFEHDGTATAEKTNWRNETARLIRLQWTGPAVTTAGTTYSNKIVRVDLAGKWERFEPIAERDGNDIVVGRFRARYNSTAAKFAEIVVVNELATLT